MDKSLGNAVGVEVETAHADVTVAPLQRTRGTARRIADTVAAGVGHPGATGITVATTETESESAGTVTTSDAMVVIESENATIASTVEEVPPLSGLTMASKQRSRRG